jgi:uncharacterized membrane protein
MFAFQYALAIIPPSHQRDTMHHTTFRTVTACLIAFLAVPAMAQERAVPVLPAIFEVTGLQAGDHLNVRSGPSAKAKDIGDLKAGALVEVTSIDPIVGWAQIVYGEWTAWAYARFLTPIETPLMSGTDLPANMNCGGTEPFWDVQISNGTKAAFTMMGAIPMVENIAYAGISSNHILKQSIQTNSWSAFLEKRQCSDGMSDRQMGITIELLAKGDDAGFRHLSGCCSLVLDADTAQ